MNELRLSLYIHGRVVREREGSAQNTIHEVGDHRNQQGSARAEEGTVKFIYALHLVSLDWLQQKLAQHPLLCIH